MKIINLKSENIKKIKAIDITPQDNTIVITGKNGAGKTSVLDSILYALGGKNALKNTPEPIRKGEKKGKIVIDLGEYIVTRTFLNTGTTSLTIQNKDGAKYTSPQNMLDNLVGSISFDPLEFAEMNEKDQKEVLLELVGVDLTDIDNLIQETFDERRFANRELKNAVTILNNCAEPRNDVPAEKINIDELRDQYSQLDRMTSNIESIQQDIERSNNIIKEAEETIALHNSKIKEFNEKILSIEKLTSKMESLEDMKKTADEAKSINAIIDSNNQWKEAKNEKDKKESIVKDLENKLKELRSKRGNLLSSAKMPISGLGISDDGVIYNDIPFSQISSAEQLKVSLSIAMAMNPKLRVIRIMDGSLIDTDNMKVINEMADTNDYQVWIERVEDSVGIHIQDGSVV